MRKKKRLILTALLCVILSAANIVTCAAAPISENIEATSETAKTQLQPMSVEAAETPAALAQAAPSQPEVIPEEETQDEPEVQLDSVQLKLKRNGNAAYLSWKNVKGSTGYLVYRRSKGKTKWTALAMLEKAERKYEDQTVVIGKSYEYFVCAIRMKGGQTWYSEEDPASVGSFCILSAPVLKKTRIGKKGILFSWKPVKGASEYIVSRRTQGGQWTELGVSAEPQYVDTTAKQGVLYYYTVRAVDESGIRGDRTPKGIPGFFISTAKQPSLRNRPEGIKLSWKKAPNVSGYRIYKMTSASAKWKKLDEVKTTSFLDADTVPGTKYKYQVVPYKTISGKQQFAFRSKTGTAQLVRLLEPELKSITSASGGLKLEWKNAVGAKKYQLYRETPNSKKWKLLATVSKNTYTDKSVKNGRIYKYSVVAVNGQSLSGLGKSTIRGIHLNAIPSFQSESLLKGLKLKWKGVKYASGYMVYRLSDSGSLQYLGKTKSTTYIDKKVRDTVSYRYVIRAYSDSCSGCPGQYKLKGYKATYNDPVYSVIRSKLNISGWSIEQAFYWARSIPFIDLQPEYPTAKEYAKWVLDNGKGDCYGKAAVFVLMARQLGYEAYVMRGYTPFANGGGSPHGWAEIKVNGEWFVCDLAYNNGGVNSAYMIKYGQKGTLRYSNYYRMP